VPTLEVPTDPVAQLGVHVGQRFVEEERLRLTHQRATHRDALALPAGELSGFACD